MFVVFDLETTGIYETSCDIIEFSYILFDSNKNFVLSEQLYFYYEGMSWSEEAYKVHQIQLSFLMQYKDQFRENCIKMYSVLQNANVIGHNSKNFDCPFARTWLMRQGIGYLNFRVIEDTMTAFRPIYKKARIKLTALAKMMDITEEVVNTMIPYWFKDAVAVEHAHQAAYDVVLTALLALKGINMRLIQFEAPEVKKVEIKQEDIDSMYSAATNVIDPNRFVVNLCDEEDIDQAYYRFVNHDYSRFADTIPTDVDVKHAGSEGRLLPIILFYSDSKSSDDKKVWEAYDDASEATYIYTECKTSGDTFSISTDYGVFSDTDVSIVNIIKNNFREV